MGIFTLAAATLMLEILLTRIVSVVAWYHLAFFVISLTMLGMTAGALLVFLRPHGDPLARRMSRASGWFAALTPLKVPFGARAKWCLGVPELKVFSVPEPKNFVGGQGGGHKSLLESLRPHGGFMGSPLFNKEATRSHLPFL